MTDDPKTTATTGEPTAAVPAEPERKGKAATYFSSTNQPAVRGKRGKDKLSLMFDLRQRLADLDFDIAHEIVTTYKAATTVGDKRKILELVARHTLPTYSKVEAEVTTNTAAPVIMWRDEFDAAIEMAQAALEEAGHVIDVEFTEQPEETKS
ncbi:hypothetical protein Sp245p_28825 (plasmid) [Azospirillum baldaniorum]|uniref:Uncharacterized protein n=1 Tax=Azospirillum baldaniorum TaxID=1064539 RepID=A0A9P1JY09_9PROT|nr:hypothetical protein [Azospirillum baldaniorum]AWJ93827.1 hypothetical protein Sp245p_28825 [Azospirillum baldaniorum]TWA81649.1 hypothetical protein FBZ85_10223 [Azospirillum brasilense]CCD01983.1 protein of unknown function [Azospirillum baldaniorum]